MGGPAELPQGLQEGQIRFPLAIVLDALTPRQPQPPRLPRQPQLDQRCLAHPGVATDKDDLPGPLDGLLEALLQDLDFGPAPDDRARRAWPPRAGRSLPS